MPISLPKSPWASRTLWVNGLTVAAAVLTALTGVSDKLPPESLPYILGVLAAVNIGLRYLTDAPIATQ